MIAVGVDVHKRQCTVAIQREDGELRLFEPMENTREGWQELLDQLPPEATPLGCIARYLPPACAGWFSSL